MVNRTTSCYAPNVWTRQKVNIHIGTYIYNCIFVAKERQGKLISSFSFSVFLGPSVCTNVFISIVLLYIACVCVLVVWLKLLLWNKEKKFSIPPIEGKVKICVWKGLEPKINIIIRINCLIKHKLDFRQTGRLVPEE